ncbi:MAG: 1-acyl-sn-glycerol-3-phosphate acyltransferase [Anaerolineaceae bacterium]|nr:MAG: 1-acyl-sn-glycerol-3-phosphate acyltransferase [Anaerolineaceae bacterium]
MTKTQRFLYFIGRNFVRFYALLMLKMDVLWESPLPDGPFLIAANHPSTSDPFYIMTPFRRPVRIMMIESPFLIPVFGRLLREAGHIAVCPRDKQAALEAACRELFSGHPVAIFPEGDTSPRTGGHLPPRTGAARLALMTGVPVVPVGIYLRRHRCTTIRSKTIGRPTVGFWHLRGPYGMTIGQPLKFSGDAENKEHIHSIAETIMESIARLASTSQARVEG